MRLLVTSLLFFSMCYLFR